MFRIGGSLNEDWIFVWIVFARDTDFDDVFTIAIINPVFFFIFMLCSELRIQAELLVEYQGYE